MIQFAHVGLERGNIFRKFLFVVFPILFIDRVDMAGRCLVLCVCVCVYVKRELCASGIVSNHGLICNAEPLGALMRFICAALGFCG